MSELAPLYVLASNLLCRLPDPAAFLRACRSLVKPGGVLVLISPYSWIKEWTPEERWLGGEEGGVCKLDPLSCEKQPVSTNFDFVEQRKDVTSVLFQLETPVRCFPELAAPLTKGL